MDRDNCFHAAKHWVGVLPLFNPEEGITVVEPPGSGSGYWAGAPSVMYDDEAEKYYLYYRLRKPRGEGRGYECRIDESTDGVTFTNIWRATKQELQTESMERAALVKCPDGAYRLYIGYVDPADNRWRVDVMEAEDPAAFDINARSKILTASDIAAEGVKDPFVLIAGRKYYMFLSYARAVHSVPDATKEQMHATADVYNTGITKSCSGLAVSLDGKDFTWLGEVLSTSEAGWDSYETRITSVSYVAPMFTAFYDGIPRVQDNYEEKTGLALSWDLCNFERITLEQPILVSPNGTGSLRYVDALLFDDRICYYYEYARVDGSHELRLNVVSR